MTYFERVEISAVIKHLATECYKNTLFLKAVHNSLTSGFITFITKFIKKEIFNTSKMGIFGNIKGELKDFSLFHLIRHDTAIADHSPFHALLQ